MYTIIFVGRLTLEPTHLQKGLPGLIQRHSCIQVASGTAIQPQSLQWGKTAIPTTTHRQEWHCSWKKIRPFNHGNPFSSGSCDDKMRLVYPCNGCYGISPESICE